MKRNPLLHFAPFLAVTMIAGCGGPPEFGGIWKGGTEPESRAMLLLVHTSGDSLRG